MKRSVFLNILKKLIFKHLALRQKLWVEELSFDLPLSSQSKGHQVHEAFMENIVLYLCELSGVQILLAFQQCSPQLLAKNQKN